jgi:hypothetical protein
MIRKCGRDSKVPVIMAVDALGAGIDTTGNTGMCDAKCPEKPFAEV